MFFPGCQLGASDPRYVTESYRWLLGRRPDTALMLGCCGAPAEWAGDKTILSGVLSKIKQEWISLGRPVAVFACPTCRRMFRRHLPEIEGVFLYRLALDLGISPLQDAAGAMASVFDPCSSREEPELQQAVRELSRQSGFVLQPLPREGSLAQCCSWGGQVSVASPRYTREVVNARITQNSNPYITYCINCRDNFGSAHKPAYHILDVLFGLHDAGRLPPTVTERRNNRVSLRHQLLREHWRGDVEMEHGKNKISLRMAPELREKLSNEMILETDIEAVIEHCEITGRKILDPDSGHFTGHLKVGNMTYWAEYFPVAEGFELVNAYGHRMSIEEA
jgi:hypothetical protein